MSVFCFSRRHESSSDSRDNATGKVLSLVPRSLRQLAGPVACHPLFRGAQKSEVSTPPGGRCFPRDTLVSLASKENLLASHFCSVLHSPSSNKQAKTSRMFLSAGSSIPTLLSHSHHKRWW